MITLRVGLGGPLYKDYQLTREQFNALKFLLLFIAAAQEAERSSAP